MTDATPSSQERRSSILYGMGRLEAVVGAQADIIKDLPARILEVIAPQLLDITKTTTDLQGRVRALERSQWLIYGGGTLAFALVGWYVEIHR